MHLCFELCQFLFELTVIYANIMNNFNRETWHIKFIFIHYFNNPGSIKNCTFFIIIFLFLFQIYINSWIYVLYTQICIYDFMYIMNLECIDDVKCFYEDQNSINNFCWKNILISLWILNMFSLDSASTLQQPSNFKFLFKIQKHDMPVLCKIFLFMLLNIWITY